MRWRHLTEGERRVAGGVFGAALRLDAIRVHWRRFFPFQPKGVAMAPDGHLYFARADHRPDLSTTLGEAAWLVHELTHVWQHQAGMWVIPRGIWERRYDYGALDPARRLRSYGIEQQAAIVEDWFLLSHGAQTRRGSGSPADYRAVIPFLPETETQ